MDSSKHPQEIVNLTKKISQDVSLVSGGINDTIFLIFAHHFAMLCIAFLVFKYKTQHISYLSNFESILRNLQ